jgi:RimJ/RimL family protein N-acetyltransferase
MELMDLDLNLGDDLRMRALVREDAALLVEATSGEPAPSLWGPRPVGPYSLHDGQAALSAWNPAAGGQFSIGILHGRRLLGAVGLMPDRPGSTELAYWMRPEARGRGIASRAVHATTGWVHLDLAIPRIWLEIDPGNEPSLRLAQRAGYHFEQRLSRHCRDWSYEDAERDSWHDCLIWAHVSDQAPAAGRDGLPADPGRLPGPSATRHPRRTGPAAPPCASHSRRTSTASRCRNG